MNISLNDTQLAGQRLMVGFDGTGVDEELQYAIRSLNVGGVVLFARNIAGPAQLRALCGSIQACARAAGQPPLFIAVDQEGGPVARLKAPFTEFPGNPHMRGPADAVEFGRTTARELAQAGINMNLAPVLDVAPAEMQSIMAGRSFGGDPDRVAELGLAVIQTLQQNGIMAVAKHFPGIGRTVLDSHLEMPATDLAAGDLEALELPPFRKAAAAGVAGVMLSHILYRRIDPVWPASLSPAIAGGMLRKALGFNGLVLTDDLDMGAIAKNFGIDTAVEQAYRAGVDLLLICHPGPNIASAHRKLAAMLQSSRSLREMGKASAERILSAKRRYLTGFWRGV